MAEAMGKHFKPEVEEKEKPYKAKFQEIREGIDDLAGSCEYYKARIKTLEKKNKELEDELKKAKAELAFNTGYLESCADATQRMVGRKDEVIKHKDEEIAMAKEAIYLAAMREVSLR